MGNLIFSSLLCDENFHYLINLNAVSKEIFHKKRVVFS